MKDDIKTQKLADNFIDLYPVSKTIRFELKPMGRTLEYIERDDILDSDYHRAESYKKVKKIIDRYHKEFIDEALSGIELKGLQEYMDLYLIAERDDKQEKQFGDLQASLRKQIVKCFTSSPKYKNLFKKELIKDELISFTEEGSEERRMVEEFVNFSTYFTGFHTNRANMYSVEAKSTAIAYRMIHQNLPKYIDNMKAYNLLKKKNGVNITDLSLIMKEKFDIESVDIFFEIEGFAKVMTQKGIDIYNGILGGFSQENDIKVQGLNEYINLFNQQIKGDERKLAKLKPLYKQILSDRGSSSFILDKFENDQEVLDAVRYFYEQFYEYVVDNSEEVTIEKLIENLDTFNLDKIYIANDSSVSGISQYLFADWSVLKKSISEHYDIEHSDLKIKKSPEKYEDTKAKELSRHKVYAIKTLNYMVEEYTGQPCSIESYFISQIADRIIAVRQAYEECKELLDPEQTREKAICKNQFAIDKLKKLLDAIKDVQQLIKPLIKGQEEPEKDELFYVELIRISSEIDKINSLYNKVRNYVTKKPYSLEKVKLNFNKSTLLDGWDRNKEKDNLGIILLKDGCYYLGIMNRGDTGVMEAAPVVQTQNVYQKMEYKLLPGPNKMLPKVFFSKSRIGEFAPDEKLLMNYDKGTHKKGGNFNLKDCHKLIDFFKRSIQKHDEWSEFDFNFSDTKTYADISGFYREVEHQGYKITFKDIDADYIDGLVEKGQLYLFQIYNKDFSSHSKGTPNLHTMYWKMLFAPENLENVVYKLNGQAEVFYRKKSIEEKDIIRHEPNNPIRNKYPDAEKATSVFEYELIKDKRFTVDKFQFHVPITMNFQAEGENHINRKVRQLIHDCKDLNVIGIDRGERNLLYLTVVDMQGNIKEQVSLNKIISCSNNGITHTKDYQLLLDQREDENKSARQNWQSINTIKELKEGYLSQVIHLIADLMIKYNAIVVLEDLNSGFMRSRQKFEKQIYQKFERMLIDKLNYLVNKKLEPSENGGVLKAYQLTDKFESFQKLGKQSGFLFYVPAWNTSKIDPTTGFVNLFYTKYETKEKSREFISKFDSIFYNEREHYFEFNFDYSEFTYKAQGSRTKWCLCSNGKRIENYRNPEKNSQWDVREIDLTEAFIDLLEKYRIDWQQDDIKESILTIDDTGFYRSFMHFISLMLQMRNSNSQTGEDWLVSPVKNDKGEFFKSDVSNKNYPCDADANGAYNIAKKGLWIVQQIQQSDIEQLDKIKLAISNKEWLAYAQEHTL